MQNLLLGMGTALVAVAAVVFTAVNWNRFGATAQGLVLVVLTVLAALATTVAARRRMPSTAEALGLVTMLLALADAHAIRVGIVAGLEVTRFWAAALVVVSLGGWALGRATGVRSTRIATAALAQLPLPVALIGTDLGPTACESLLVLQAAVVITLVVRARKALRPARVMAASLSVATWGLVSLVALASVPFEDGRDRLGPAAVLALAGAAAALVAWLRGSQEVDRSAALLSASVLGFTAALVVADLEAPGDLTAPAMAALAVLVLAIGTRVPRRWGQAPSGVAAVTAGAASLPVLGASAAVAAAAVEVASRPWSAGAGVNAASLVPDGVVPSSGPLAMHLLLLAALVLAARPVLGRRLAGLGLVLTATIAVLAAPLLLPLSAGGASAVALLGALGAVALAGYFGDRRPVLITGAVVATITAGQAALWAVAAAATSLVAGAAIALLAAALAVAARRYHEPVVAVPAAIVAVLAGAVEAGVAFAANGSEGAVPLVAASVTALALGLICSQLLDPAGRRRDLDGVLSAAVEIVAGVVHAWVLLVVVGTGDAQAATVVLAAGVLAAGLHAARPGRRALALVAVAEALALSWLQLGLAGVSAVEAYTGPLALVLAATGLWVDRRARRGGETLSSWVTLGPALVLSLAPTVVVGLGDTGLVRPLGGLVAGSLVLVVGALTRRRALVDVGVAVVALLGMRQLAPVVGELPNWATLGVTGLALLAVGATFEQRRRDLHDVKDRYESLI